MRLHRRRHGLARVGDARGGGEWEGCGKDGKHVGTRRPRRESRVPRILPFARGSGRGANGRGPREDRRRRDRFRARHRFRRRRRERGREVRAFPGARGRRADVGVAREVPVSARRVRPAGVVRQPARADARRLRPHGDAVPQVRQAARAVRGRRAGGAGLARPREVQARRGRVARRVRGGATRVF